MPNAKAERGGLWLISLLVIGSLFYPSASTPSSGTPAADGSRSQSAKTDPHTSPAGSSPAIDPCDEDVIRLVRSLVRMESEDGSTHGSNSNSSESHRSHVSLEFLVATVPDPIDSHVGWLFDGALDAIQRALEASNYVLDRYSLPWECRSDENRSASGQPRLHARRPGVVVFRNRTARTSAWDVIKSGNFSWEGLPWRKIDWDRIVSQGIDWDKWDTIDWNEFYRDDYLVLFLVGETPTSGVHAKALEAALDAVAELSDWPDDPAAAKQVRLMGPTFSGSADSLMHVLRHWSERQKPKILSDLRFNIVSGSATSINPDTLKKSVPKVNVSFKATVIPDNVVYRKFYEYLETELGVNLRRVAVLTEANTAYGRRFVDDVEELHKAQKDADKEKGRPLVLPFPMQISHVRSAYEKSKLLTRDRTAAAGADSRKGLELSLEDSSTPRDLVPTLYPSMTAGSAELVLANILSTISYEEIQYVGLLATDARDKLFLARQIRTYCPDVCLFTFEGDLLYSHPDFNADMDGMIVASTYPLFNKNQYWTRSKDHGKERLQFPNTLAQGVYNATLALLDRSDLLLEYRVPFQKVQEQQDVGPPIWLTVVSNGALWPVKFYTVESGDDSHKEYNNYVYSYRPGLVKETHAADQPEFWMIVLILVTFFCIANCVGYFGAVYWIHEEPERWLVVRMFWPRRCPRYQREQQVFMLVCFVTQLIVYMFLAAIYFLSYDPQRWWPWPTVIVACLLLLTATSVDVARHVVVELLRTIKSFWRGGRWLAFSDFIRAFAILALAGTAIVLSICCALPSVRQSHAQAMLVFERATKLGNGLSPVSPVLFLGGGLYFWSVRQLKRLRLLDRFAVPNPFPRFQAMATAGIAELNAQLRYVLKNPFLRRPGLLLTSFLLVFGFLPSSWLYRRFLPTFEGPVFDQLFKFGLFLLYFGILAALLQFVAIWQHFRRLLHRLAWHPMVEAYNRLPSKLSRTIGSQFYASVPAFTELELPVQQCLRVATRFGDVSAELFSDPDLSAETKALLLQRLDAARRVGDAFVSELPDNTSCTVALACSRTQRLLSRAARVLLETLDLFWRKRSPSVVSQGKAPAATPVAAASISPQPAFSDAAQLWFQLAEDFAATQIVAYISQVFAHLRNILTLIIAALLLMLVTVNSYSFQPHRLLMIFVWSVILSAVTVTIVFFYQVNRDEVLSRIAKTEPNQLTWDRSFVSGVLTYGVLPVLGLLAAQFPEIGGKFFAWFEPLLRAFK